MEEEMNTPRETLGPLQNGLHRNVQIGSVVLDGKETYVKIDANNGVDIHVMGDYQVALLTRKEAIDAAQAILIAYNVPFKNAVKGAGL
jgi:hypothetical protein